MLSQILKDKQGLADGRRDRSLLGVCKGQCSLTISPSPGLYACPPPGRLIQTFLPCLSSPWASLAAQMVKNLPSLQETWVGSLGQEDHLEEAMAPHSSILAWEIPWTEEPGGL